MLECNGPIRCACLLSPGVVMTHPAVEQQTGETQSFAETALKLGGKSEEEARRTGAIDRADDQVEGLFQAQYQTVNSPIHRAIWERRLPVELFQASYESTPPDVQAVMSRSLEVVRRHRLAKTLHNADDKIA